MIEAEPEEVEITEEEALETKQLIEEIVEAKLEEIQEKIKE